MADEVDYPFRYVRERYADNIQNQTISLTNDAGLTDFYVLIKKNQVDEDNNETFRIEYFSQKPLSDKTLDGLDVHLSSGYMPLTTLEHPCRNYIHREDNFFLALSEPINSLTPLVEYRTLTQRAIPANRVQGFESKKVYRLVPRPNVDRDLVIIMPENFIRTSLNTGYFDYRQHQLIVKFYGKNCLFSGANSNERSLKDIPDSVVSNNRTVVKEAITSLFSRMGFNDVSSPQPNQFVASDKYILAVVGVTSNLDLPQDVVLQHI